MKIAIVADSTAYIPEEKKPECIFESVPINVLFEGKIYQDGINLTAEQAYQFLEKNPEEFATSAPSPGDFLAAYKKVASQGIKEIICLTLFPKVSATWNSARMAKDLAKTELPGVRIEVVNSGTAIVGESLMVLRISEAIKEGQSFEELVKLAEELKDKIRVYLSLETIRYIYRSGRIPEVASKLGSILPLKPILGIHKERVAFAGAGTSKEKSKQKIINELKENLDQNFPQIGIMHIECLKEAEDFKKEITSLFPKSQVFITSFSPIIGYVTGKGTIGIGFFAK